MISLAGSAAAPDLAALLGAFALVGVTTAAGQLLVPLTGELARDDQRGRVVGTVASGMIIGILVSRAISCLVADAFGRRAVYVMAAVLMVVLAAALAWVLPALPPRASAGYGALLASARRVGPRDDRRRRPGRHRADRLGTRAADADRSPTPPATSPFTRERGGPTRSVLP
ncbi:MFS transporter [Streptomyces sp. 2A115]|uniref:MFS transporter n=1 Tax=Streptomyces sp. 2A115 TaxID=3457439 RepID=UPI003FD02C9C